MISIHFKDANGELIPPDGSPDEAIPMSAFIGMDYSGFNCVVVAFQPSKEDIEAIKAGSAIYVKLLTDPTNIPITTLFTLDEKENFNE